jgi:hypothetical protein
MKKQSHSALISVSMTILLMIIVFPACKKTPVIGSLCSMELPALAPAIPLTIFSDSVENGTGNLICRNQKAKFGPQYQEVISLDPQGTVIYPGGMLNYKSFQDGTYIPIVGARKPIVVSISLSNINGLVSQKITDPSLSSFREAMQKILQSKVTGATAAKIAWHQTTVYTEKQFRLSIAGNFGSLWADVSGQYNYNNKEIIGRFFLEFTQEYYSVDMDLPKPGMDNFFDRVECVQAGGISPVYVSSVKYGRKAFLMIESKTIDNSQAAEIKASFDGFFASGGINSDLTLQRLINEKSIKGVIIGGPSYEGIKAITSVGSLKDYLLAGANFNESSPGVPLSYTLRFVNDNSIAKLAMYDEFTIRDCQIIPPTSTSFQADPIKELGLNHVNGDPDFHGNGPDVKITVRLSVRNNDKEVWAYVHVNMKEVGGDHTTGDREYEVKLWTCPAGKRILQISTEKEQTLIYRDVDTLGDTFIFPLSKVMARVEFWGDRNGDDLNIIDVDAAAHLHKLIFNPIAVQLVNE